MTRRLRQQGSATAIVIGVLTAALIGALGWIFWQNFMIKDDVAQNTAQESNDAAKVEKAGNVDKEDAGEAAEQKYVDLRTAGNDNSGYVIAAAKDAKNLSGASQALKDYFAIDAGQEITVWDGQTIKSTYTIDRVYGNYAVGQHSGTSAVLLWGPTEGTGKIDRVAGTQNIGFLCEDLMKANVPAELVDGRCFDPSLGIADTTEYSQ